MHFSYSEFYPVKGLKEVISLLYVMANDLHDLARQIISVIEPRRLITGTS